MKIVKTIKLLKNGQKSSKRREKLFEKKLSTQSETKPFCNHKKSKTKSKLSVGSLKINNNLVTDSYEKISALKNFFMSVFQMKILVKYQFQTTLTPILF